MNDSPRGATKLGSLETGRFIAASMVMLEHFADFTQQYAAPGQRIFGNWSPPAPLGVEFFFVLSGFVMASAHHADFGRLAAIPRFWWRRACRIYPVYWLALCVPMYLFWRSLGAASLLHLYLLDPWGDISLIPPSWTLRYEMAFYIALGLCMLPYIGKPLLGLWIATTLWCHMPLGLLAFFHLEPPFFPNRLYGALGLKFGSVLEYHFFAGLAAGWLFIRCPPARALSWAALGLGVMLFLLLLPVSHYGTDYGPVPFYTMLVALSFALIILGLARLERLGALCFGTAAVRLGALSYPLYILHTSLMLAATLNLPAMHLHGAGFYVFSAVALAAIYGITAVATFCFDQPIQRLLRRRNGHPAG